MKEEPKPEVKDVKKQPKAAKKKVKEQPKPEVQETKRPIEPVTVPEKSPLEELLESQMYGADSRPAPPTAKSLKTEEAAKKWGRVCLKVKKMLVIERRLQEFEQYDRLLVTQRKGIDRMQKRLKRQLEQLVLPKDHMHQNQLVESYSEFVTVETGSKHI